MKKLLLIVIILAAIGGGVFWLERSKASSAESAKPAAEKTEEKAAAIKISRDDKGNVVISIDEKTQRDNGIVVAGTEPAQFDQEVMGYGRVLDPAPLAGLMSELASAQAAYAASGAELARLKTLAGQGNASARALQTGEAAALHDQLAVQSAKDRLALGWGKAVAEQSDSAAFLKSLASLNLVLVRIDLPGGQTLPSSPLRARLVLLSGDSVNAEFFDTASSVDPQTQGRGFVFLARTNTSGLLPGAAVTGFITIQGPPLVGVLVPGAAVVRTEGSAWVYVRQTKLEDFARIPVALDRPLKDGWFVTNGVAASNSVVITGAQMLLSEELKGSAKPEPD